MKDRLNEMWSVEHLLFNAQFHGRCSHFSVALSHDELSRLLTLQKQHFAVIP